MVDYPGRRTEENQGVPHSDPHRDQRRSRCLAAAFGKRQHVDFRQPGRAGGLCRPVRSPRQRNAPGSNARAHCACRRRDQSLDDCLSAHGCLGKNLAKLDDAEIAANRNGSNDPKADAAVRFAAKVVRERGHVSEDDVRAVKLAGYDDAQVIEIVLHVALNS